ncbi:MAG: release factor glutamine methyltransferase [Gammaproteobacteria bacterium]|jgi:release factor glutamine methyltransferase
MTRTNTVRELLALAERSMESINSARLDAEVLLAKCMSTDRASLYVRPEQEVTEDIVTNFHYLLSKRKDYYPLAYLIGKKEFWSLELLVDQHTLIPRPETECLVETALEMIQKHQPEDILDMGTGSGAIALAIASERPECRVLAIDLCHNALAVSTENARKHGIANVEFLQSDWFSALQGRQFDMILSNPPYVESADCGFISGEIRHEPRQALDGGIHGMRAFTQLIPAAMHYLKPKGHLILEHGYKQAQAIREMLLANQYQNIVTKQDYAGLDRLSFAQWP